MICRAAVPSLTPIPNWAPQNWANSFSKCLHILSQEEVHALKYFFHSGKNLIFEGDILGVQID